ncbi:MAG: hypothetical protein H0W02_12725 [Ktedonobacteraceae bacterium]|nr:hypothetical protein [Ktedonobacteraceae bacterium]
MSQWQNSDEDTKEQPSFGSVIRQLRRQRNLTQAELGGERFSKSYVSAVELEKICPSQEAIDFFAEQLDQPADGLRRFLRQGSNVKSLTLPSDLPVYELAHCSIQEEIILLLDILLEGAEPSTSLFQYKLPLLSPEMLVGLPLQTQACYVFLYGLVAGQKGELATARDAFEQAFPSAPPKYHAAILDELGMNYYQEQNYQSALSYHRRALTLLKEDGANGANTIPNSRLRIELHCGNDYQALGLHRQAYTHFDRARMYLSVTHDMQTAGQIYRGLGYCMYAAAYQSRTGSQAVSRDPLSMDEKEREFQRAGSYLLQSRTLCQVSNDRLGESNVRLLQAMVLLDYCEQRKQVAREKFRIQGTPVSVSGVALLDEAEEQCWQTLILWQEHMLTQVDPPPLDLEAVIYVALAYIIRVFVQRAALARLGGYSDTALQERARAAQLCQQVLATFSQPAFPWDFIRGLSGLQVRTVVYQSQPLPRLPDPSALTQHVQRSPICQAEVYLAAGELAEELGSAALDLNYAFDCYRRADQCFQSSLKAMRQAIPDEARDPSYLARCYQRCISVLEGRIQDVPDTAQETMQVLVSILKSSLHYLPCSIAPPQTS